MSLPPPPSSRTLVLCFDGTGNCADTRGGTNVSRLYEALERNHPDKQLLYYQPGIGTYISPTLMWAHTFSKICKLVDKAFGWFLGDHVLKGYRFLMQHYKHGDQICFFGFSRGAYTAQVLAGMLERVGLLPPGNEEQVAFAWKRYLDDGPTGEDRAKLFKHTFAIDVKVSFVGAWDTVASVGVFGHNAGFTFFNPGIQSFRHAVALDERRSKFRPFQRHTPEKGDEEAIDPWIDRLNENKRRQWRETGFGEDWERNMFETNHREVWFAGCHSDVGGSGDLANIPLGWMVKEAILAGLDIIFKPGAFAAFPGVRATIGEKACNLARIEVQPEILLSDSEEGEALSNMTPYMRLDEYFNWSAMPMPLFPGSTGQDRRKLTTEAPQPVVQDACAEIHDQLKLTPFWWILEWIPLWERYVDRHGRVSTRTRWNRGRGRIIEKEDCLVHYSASVRRRILGYEPRATWSGKAVFVD